MTRRISTVWFCAQDVNSLTAAAENGEKMRQHNRSVLFTQALCQELGHEVDQLCSGKPVGRNVSDSFSSLVHIPAVPLVPPVPLLKFQYSAKKKVE